MTIDHFMTYGVFPEEKGQEMYNTKNLTFEMNQDDPLVGMKEGWIKREQLRV